MPLVGSQTPAPTEIVTARLLLRPPRLEDVDAYHALVSDPEYAFFGARQAADRDATRRGLAKIVVTPWAQRPEFAIVHDGRVVGRVVLEMDRTNQTAALGYGIARPAWGSGLATEAAHAMMTYGFEEFDLAKVWARADPRNGASVRVLEKIGMIREGLLRSHLIVRGERVDRVYYGILRSEWEATAPAESHSPLPATGSR